MLRESGPAGIEPVTYKSQVQRPTAKLPRNTTYIYNIHVQPAIPRLPITIIWLINLESGFDEFEKFLSKFMNSTKF